MGGNAKYFVQLKKKKKKKVKLPKQNSKNWMQEYD